MPVAVLPVVVRSKAVAQEVEALLPGFTDVNNRLGMNCFNCHKEAKAEFDMVCEQDHRCAPIPITLAMFGAAKGPIPVARMR